MNNKTKFKWEIKLRCDGVFDLYFGGRHIISRGSVEGILAELKTLMEENV